MTHAPTPRRPHPLLCITLSIACACGLLSTPAGSAQAATEPAAPAAADKPADKPADFSAAERALFMSDQLGKLRPPTTLAYRFRKTGSLEPGFDDSVRVKLAARPDGKCCAVTGEFFTGARRLPMPEAEDARGNPVIMYFLERDVREMQRLTKGQPNHFRKRIRMAIFEGAKLRDVAVPFRGKSVAGREIEITPYLTDPNRPRFETLATKRYVFTLSDAVPGGVYAMRTEVDAPTAGTEPVVREELLISGADQKSTH
jgi:hypothetical protein